MLETTQQIETVFLENVYFDKLDFNSIIPSYKRHLGDWAQLVPFDNYLPFTISVLKVLKSCS